MGDAWKMSDGGAQAQEFRKIVGMPKPSGDGFDWEIDRLRLILIQELGTNGCLKVTGQWLVLKELTPICCYVVTSEIHQHFAKSHFMYRVTILLSNNLLLT